MRASGSARTVAGLRPNPSVSAQVRERRRHRPLSRVRPAETTVTFSMPVELGGKRGARVGVADARIDRAQLDAAITLADVRLKVTRAYIEAVAAERRLGIARDQLKIADEALRVAKDRVMVGEEARRSTSSALPSTRSTRRPTWSAPSAPIKWRGAISRC